MAREIPEFCLDIPSSETPFLDPLGFKVEGWLHSPSSSSISHIQFFVDDQLAGESTLLFPRPDVSFAFGVPDGFVGFALFAQAPWAFGMSRSDCRIVAVSEGNLKELKRFPLSWISRSYQNLPYGNLLTAGFDMLFHRNHIYQTGPAAREASPEGVDLVGRYLDKPKGRILDVGCGVGAYGQPLIARGFDWMGVEIDPRNCAELRNKGLPHFQTDGGPLPFGDNEFDFAISIEVLEHVSEPEAFLRELKRIARRRVILSVPNIGILPYLHPMLAAPWHVLEADHKNFFTTENLKRLLASSGFSEIEIIPYGPHPLKSAEGFPLYYHLLAVCSKTQ